MKYPQTLAKELYSLFPCNALLNIADNACLAFVMQWCLGVEPDEDIMAICNVQMMINAGAIDRNCVVLWYKLVPFLTGRDLQNVEFKNIDTIRNIKKRTPVLYKVNPEDKIGHWVGVERGRIGFNPLAHSNCVENGKPVEARILTLSGVGKV